MDLAGECIEPMSRRRARLRGSAGIAVAFWTVAIALLALPFLRARDRLSLPSEDWARAGQRRSFEERYADEGRVFPDLPFAADVARFEQEFKLELGAHIAEASQRYFAPDSRALAESGLFDLERLPGGQRSYSLHCIGCHGEIGDGAGPAARYLAPRPRNFRKGLFKFTSTEAGARPRRADLIRTVTAGLVGSSMPSFRLLPEDVRLDLVEYVRWLAARGEFEQMLLDSAWDEEELTDPREAAELVYKRWDPDRLRPIHPGSMESDFEPASIDRGRALFNDASRANCATCHGPEGRGDGVTAGDYLDDWGYPIRPRDLQSGVFRAGSESADLYRTISAGIKGTPMPAFGGALSPEEIWDLVHFVQSLARGRTEVR